MKQAQKACTRQHQNIYIVVCLLLLGTLCCLASYNTSGWVRQKSDFYKMITKSTAAFHNFVGSEQQGHRTTPQRRPNASSHCPIDHFSGVLLIVVFNFPFYNNIPTLRRMYEPVFPGIYFCGPSSKTPSKLVHEMDVRNGYFGYACLAQAIQDHPDKKGYMYINDDMIVNWWSLARFDLNKAWQGPRHFDNSQDAYNKTHGTWHWWNTDMGLSQCPLVYEELVKRASIEGELGRRFNESLLMSLANGKGRPRCTISYSDFVYIPRRLSEHASRLLFICFQKRLFLEISIPTVLRMLDWARNIQIVDGVYLPEQGVFNSDDAIQFWTRYNTNVTFVHPFKFNGPTSKGINAAIIDIVVELGVAKLEQMCTSRQ